MIPIDWLTIVYQAGSLRLWLYCSSRESHGPYLDYLSSEPYKFQLGYDDGSNGTPPYNLYAILGDDSISDALDFQGLLEFFLEDYHAQR